MPRNRRLSVAALGKFSRVTGSHGTELSAIRRIDRAVRVTIGGARQDECVSSNKEGYTDRPSTARRNRRQSARRPSNRLKSWLHDLIAYRVANERGGRRELELAHDGSAVRLNGLKADV